MAGSSKDYTTPAPRERPAGRAGRRRTRAAAGPQRGRPLWMLAPGGLPMVLVILIPLVFAVYMSFTDLDQYSIRHWATAPFIGFANYVEALARTPLLRSVWLSVSFSVIATMLTVPVGIAAALVAQNPYRGRAIVRSVFLIPYVIPSFVTATVWRTILQPDGLLNTALGGIGIHAGLWLNGPASFWTLILVETWAAWPFIYLLALAGLQSVHHEVHEAAALDGTGWWNKLRYVILPYLKGPLALGFLLGTLNHINNFTLPYVLFGSPAPDDVNVLPMITYATSFQSFRFGLSAAMAMVSLLLIAVPLMVYLRAVRLDTHEDGRIK